MAKISRTCCTGPALQAWCNPFSRDWIAQVEIWRWEIVDKVLAFSTPTTTGPPPGFGPDKRARPFYTSPSPRD